MAGSKSKHGKQSRQGKRSSGEKKAVKRANGKACVTRRKFSVDKEVSLHKTPAAGAAVAFLGMVRGKTSRGGKTHTVSNIEFEAYERMADERLEEIRKEAIKKFGLENAIIEHRLGKLKSGENIVMIIALSSHRKESFKACEWMIDEIKRTVPIWKKEHTSEGGHWVEGERLGKRRKGSK